MTRQDEPAPHAVRSPRLHPLATLLTRAIRALATRWPIHPAAAAPAVARDWSRAPVIETTWTELNH